MLVHQQVTLSRPHISSTQPGSDFSHAGRRAVTVAHRLPRSLTVTASSRASSRAFSLSAHKRYKCAGGWPTGAGMELKGKCPDPCPQGDRQISAVRVTAPPPAPLITCSRRNPGPRTLMSVCLHPTPSLCSFIPTFGISPEQSVRPKSLSQPLCSQGNTDRDEAAARAASSLVTYMAQPLRGGLYHLSGEIPRG